MIDERSEEAGEEAMMDGGLSPETEELLRRARVGVRMTPARKRRLKGAVLARIAFGSAAMLGAGQATVSAMSVAAKIAVAVAVVGSVGGGSYLALRPAQPRIELQAPRAAAPRAIIVPESPPIEVAPPARMRPRRPVERRVALAPASTLADETKLLRDADRALRAGDSVTALARLDEHASRFPKGALAPERSAERLIVQCELGAADSRAVSQFLAARSGAPLAARVRRACLAKR